MESRDVSLDEVRALVAERQRFDDWISALEARRAETPVRVFDRVHSDYVGRRTVVLEKLRDHVDAISGHRAELEARIVALEERLGAHEDERAEAMLRTAVGEYDGHRWEQMRQDVEASIATLADERNGLLASVADVRSLLASARADVSAPPSASLPATGPSSGHSATAPLGDDFSWTREEVRADVRPPSGSQATVAELMRSPAVPAMDTAPHGTPALRSTDADREPYPADTTHSRTDVAAASGAHAITDSAPVTHTDTEFDDALALFSSNPHSIAAQPEPFSHPTPSRIDPFRQSAPSGYESLSLTPASPSPASFTPSPSLGASPAAPSIEAEPRTESFDDMAFLRSVIDPSAQSAVPRAGSGGDQQKILRCTECGTMNFPTEWYCERCGGELAAF